MLNRLPIEIIREHIIPYTYNPQPEKLCEDIRSFHCVHEHLYEVYYKRWENIEPGEYINWLENDIIRFLNNDKATMWGYVENYLEKLSRLYLLKDKTKKAVRQYIHTKIMHFEAKYAIKTFLGLLTPDERLELVNFTYRFKIDEYEENILNYLG